MKSSRSSWWVGFKVSMDVFDVSCLFSWSQGPGVQGKCRHTRAKYFSISKAWNKTTNIEIVWVRCSAVLPGAVYSRTHISSPGCKTPITAVSDKSKTFQEDEKLFIFRYELLKNYLWR